MQAAEEQTLRRDRVLRDLVAALRDDARIAAAWLGGSLGRGVGDALSDIDLTVVVTDADLCARPWSVSSQTTAARRALIACAGEPVIVHENHHNAPPGGSFTCVVYRSAIEVDWTVIPRATATRPPATRVLFDHVGVPLAPPPEPLAPEARAARASERVAFFWLMAAVTAKYAVCGDIVYAHHLSLTLDGLVRDVRDLITGAPAPYQGGSTGAVVPLENPPAAVKGLCVEMERLAPGLLALGGMAPHDPMRVVDAIFSLAHTT